ncbi:MAG: DoxX family protein [Bacteroidetes bacterium]|nr:MAG: DoxX family protein [Bacteroidota bacterium]
MKKDSLINILLWISRLLFGVIFIFSGFVKAIDPLGSTYKFQDYFMAFGTEWLFPTALPLSIFMSGLEFVIGFTVLLGIKMRYSAWGGLLFMLVFTPLTLYIAIFEPVSDCGCFGDALIISNWATFYKNIFILAAAVFIFVYKDRVKPLWSERKDWYLVILLFVFITWLSVYGIRNLPVIDFRPWKVGNNIEEQMQPIQDEIAEFYFIYRNTETGEQKEFAVSDLPAAEDGWEYVDRKEIIIQEYIEAPIDDFVIQDESGFDVADIYLGNPDYQFLLIVYDVRRTNEKAFEKRINDFAAQADSDDVSFIALTGSSLDDIDVFRHQIQAAYPFYQSDAIKLKTIVRANPGLVLMKDWEVIAKWHHRNIPSYEEVKKKYMKE